MRKKQSKGKAYLKGKKLLSGAHLDFTLKNIIDGSLKNSCTFDSILIEEIPENLSKDFWENVLYACRGALTLKGKIYAILPRHGVQLPYEILRETDIFTIYLISK